MNKLKRLIKRILGLKDKEIPNIDDVRDEVDQERINKELDIG